MHRQLEYLQQYQQRVGALIGAGRPRDSSIKHLSCSPLVGMILSTTITWFLTLQGLANMICQVMSSILISEYKKLLMRLYNLGARRVLVTGTGPLGCVPAELAMRSTNGGCSAELQRAAALYNPQLESMITDVNRQIGSDVFIAANTHQMHADFVSNPQAYGFTTAKIACCGQGPYNGVGLCTMLSNLCPNRDLYAFWDPFHPSEKANKIVVQTDHDWLHPIHETYESQHHHGHGFQDLIDHLMSPPS
ncbi:hypothetical protein NC651_030081 [Populus alba x Populus x berolinensis]|nr:hypothetical protein NC651_030081 [Populus alba x Populus x berolinensis]